MSVTRLDFVSAMVYNFENNGYYLITGSQPSIYQKFGSNAIAGVMALLFALAGHVVSVFIYW
jgi:hypothetical protein